MPTTKYTIEVTKNGDHFEAKVASLNISATGATFDQAAINAENAIVAAELKRKRARKPVSAGKKTREHQKAS